MNHPTYKEQFDKITSAYINNELNPWKCSACFVGNLLNGSADWAEFRELNDNAPYEWQSRMIPSEHKIARKCLIIESGGIYSIQEIEILELNFLNMIGDLKKGDDGYEESLFKAMDYTLEYLRQIHINKGEIIDDAPVFEKRKLQLI